jgi:hypothetical protein
MHINPMPPNPPEDGGRWLLLHLPTFNGGQQGIYLGLVKDVTHERPRAMPTVHLSDLKRDFLQ